ncbi:adenylate cyclase type 10-like [Gallus gallus]|uniref:adenylate cyclase type 10-like n=1 Tax=Gallus gallus TaxID=9031 RepID=UPI001AEB7C8C|nr:adenylate cyclase type 10-like [Gallus gallus]XP_046791879.1 adenylate cyclase type 10-like [Gallus gallus]XP_046793716.1 adenylate cyclase type 10-like [Gallus gallus]
MGLLQCIALGFKVNLAARMMVAYPGVVSCDAETCAASRLPSYCFRALPKRNLKGVISPTTVYQYVGTTEKQQRDVGVAEERSPYGPLLGREAEIDRFEFCLEAYKHLEEPHVLAFVGIPGSGKSHLLAELAILGRAAGHRVNAVELAEENLKQPFSAIRLLVARALGLQAGETCSDRQRALQTVLQGTIEESSYCLLNDVFLVEFPITDEVCRMRHTEWNSAFHLTCTQVLQKVLGGEFGIFFVDNAHFVDSESWSIMWPLLQSVTVLMVMSLAPGRDRAEDIFKAATDSTTSERITCLRLEGLKASDVVRKACQELGVRSIPRELARFLIQRSSGIPYYCEELLRSLRCNNMLLLHTGRPKEGEDSWQSLMAKASPAVTAASSPGSGCDGERMCAIRPDVNLETSMLPFALKEIALAELDRMDLQKQMVLKFAAIIGPVFTTQQLVHILPISVNQWINPLLDMLVKDNILKRLENTEEPEDVQGAPEGPATSGQAGSGVERPSVNTGSRKQQSDVLAFCAPLLWEATYELWPTRERVNIHRQCAAFLEKHAHKCQRCHGGDFVAFHRFGVSSPQKQGSCQGSADEDDCCSWEALVVAGEHLRRARTHPAEGEILAEGEQTTLRAEDGGECSCQCEAIAEAVLVPLARHYRAMGSTSQALYYVLECAAAYLHVSNSYMALMKLSEAEALRSSIKKEGNAIDCFEEAIFFSLKGEVCSNVGCVKLAKEMSRQALRLLEKRFPRTRAGAFVKSLWEGLKRAPQATGRASFLPQEARRKKQAWLVHQSRCLSLLEDLYSQEDTSGGQRFSRLAALMKANMDSKMHSYQAADSHIGQALN